MDTVRPLTHDGEVADHTTPLWQIKDYTGCHVRIAPSAMKEEYRSEEWFTAIAAAGSGCKAGAGGNSVFLQYYDGDVSQMHMNVVVRLATPEEITAFEERKAITPQMRGW